MLTAWVLGLGLLGPGLTSWRASRSLLSGEERYVFRGVEVPVPRVLGPRERRRTTPAVRLALAAAEEAVAESGLSPKHLPSIFAWAHGDGAVVQSILEELSTGERYVSPSEFHNSVYNVAAGYWAIATGSQESSSSIAAGKDTFPASLLKALIQIRSENRPLLLVVSDTPFLEPLNSVRAVGAPFGVALVLAPSASAGAIARVGARYEDCPTEGEASPRLVKLYELWSLNAAARAIPLLERISDGAASMLQIPYGEDGRLVVEVTAC